MQQQQQQQQTQTALEDALVALDSALEQAVRDGACEPIALAELAALHATLAELAEAQAGTRAAKEHFADLFAVRSAACTECYRFLFLQLFDALDTSNHTGERQRYELEAVPIDPACALLRVSPAPVPLTLYNDNAAVVKLPQSPLVGARGFAAAVERCVRRFEAECEAIADYETRLSALETDWAPPLSRAVDAVMARTQALVDRDAVPSPLLAAVVTAVDRWMRDEATERVNCEAYAENVRAKFLVVAQFYDNALRAYRSSCTQAPVGGDTLPLATIF